MDRPSPANRRRLPAALAAIATSLLVLTACSSADDSASSSASTTSSPIGTTTMTSLSQLSGTYQATVTSPGAPPAAVVDGSPVGLVFDGGQVSVSTGCNGGHGTVALADDHLSVSDLATTRKACAPELMAQEQWVTQMLADAQVEVDDAGLTLRWGPDRAYWLTFTPAQAK